ncbi:MAG: hypothetical protein HFJ75_00320 [Eggerthellaceae bacterium]|nr:hypothetical protein [Eggerthellaceae bacterium]
MTELQDSVHVLDNFDPKAYEQAEPPLVSIYLPIHRDQREEPRRDEWDGIELKDLTEEAERTLREKFPNEKDWAGIAERLAYLEGHPDLKLWQDAGAGIALLVSNTDVYAFNLDFAVDPCVVVGARYYTKPLLRNFQYGMHYYLLLLNTDRFGLLKGDYNGVHYVPMPQGVDDEFAELFIDYDGDISALDYYSLEGHMSPYHDHKSRKEVADEEAKKFFRYVDKVMNDKLVRDDPTPVILVTLPEHEHMFRELCTFPTLLPEGIKKDARTLSGTELRDDAVAIMEADRKAKLQKVQEEYQYDLSKGKATDDLNELALALVERKVKALFVQEGKDIPGTFDPKTGELFFDPDTDPTDDKKIDPASPDLVDAFAQCALAQDAHIYVLPADQMPGNKGVAAIYRY